MNRYSFVVGLCALVLLSACQSWDNDGGGTHESGGRLLRQNGTYDPGERLIAEAQRHYKAGQINLAFEVLEVAIRTGTDKVSAYLEYARMLTEQGMLQQALELGKRALTLSGDKRQRRRIDRQIRKLKKALASQ